MPGHNWELAATKFISSFVKLLHILCTGQVDFNESIELVGHINVRVDHKYKFDYILDEQVSKRGEDSATTFLSNSYYSCHPSKLDKKTELPTELSQDTVFSELHQNIHEGLSQSGPSQDYIGQSQGFSAEDTLTGRNETCINYSVTVGSSDKREVQRNQLKIKLEGENYSSDCMFLPASLGDNEQVHEQGGEDFQTASQSSLLEEAQTNQVVHIKKCQQSIEGDSGMRDAHHVIGIGLLGRAVKYEGTKQIVKKTSPVFSCKEYLDRYKSFYAKKTKHFNKQEMMKVFSDLAQKYGVTITIKPAKFSAPLNKTCDTTTKEREISAKVGHKDLQHSNKLHISREIEIDKASGTGVSHLPHTPVTPSLQSDSQTITVFTADTGCLSCNHPASYSHGEGNQAILQDLVHDISNNVIVLSDSLMPFTASELSTLDQQDVHRIIVQETSCVDIPCVMQKSLQSSEKSIENNRSEITSRSTLERSDVIESDTSSSTLLNAIAVALAEEESSSSSSTSHFCVQKYFRQQPMPKLHRGNFLVCLRKEDPEHYKHYKCLSKVEQARERRRISEANRDPDVLERKSLMNRVLYFRRVNKLPPGLRDKSNDEIKNMSTDDLKKLLPPTKSLKNMDPAAKEEWYRLGRSREWRRRKKLLDPEGFKRYNNERAKRYQENLRKNNPEKYKELRAKGADRLRQYRFSQRILKAVKDGKEIKISDSVPSVKRKQKRFRDNRKSESVIEVQEAEEELLIDENISKSHYVIPECATTHGEAATGRESSSIRTDHAVQPDILDLMYNY